MIFRYKISISLLTVLCLTGAPRTARYGAAQDNDFPDIESAMRLLEGGAPPEAGPEPPAEPEFPAAPPEAAAAPMGSAAPENAEPEVPPAFFLRHADDMPVAAIDDAISEELISIMLDEVLLQDVVRMFTHISGANIIASGTNLQGSVTVSLSDVHWKTALTSILDMHNLVLREQTHGSGVYSIVPRAPDEPEPLRIEPVFLRYARVDDAQAIVRGLLAAGGSVSAYPSGNALIVRSTAENLAEIRSVIDSIDLPRQQVYIEAKFLELNDQAIRDLGINWQVLEGYRVGISEIGWGLSETRRWEAARDDRILRGEQREQTDTLTEYYDVYGVQRGLQDRLLRDPDLPVEPTRTVEDAFRRSREITSDQADVFTRRIDDVRTAVLSAQDLSIVLSALRQIDGVSIVSNPKIIVANEETATIHIGEKERPFISSVTPGQQGIAPVVTYNPGDEVDFGVKLNVMPTINTDNNITVKIEPELTRFVRNAIAPNGQTYPIISTKTIRTVFSLESGKTAAIGGLTETLERDATKKIPLLGDLPLLGRFLFSHEHREKAQKETIIFVTVGLANPEDIRRDGGIPEDSELIFRHLNRDALRAIDRETPEEGQEQSALRSRMRLPRQR